MRGNERHGPYSETEIRNQVSAGIVGPETLSWSPGQADWVPLAEHPLAALSWPSSPPVPYRPSAVTSPAPAAPAPQVIIVRDSPMVPQNFNATFGGQRGSGLALAALACGIMSFFFFLPAIPAIVLGHAARGAIRRDPSLTGKGMATAGMLIGYFIVVCGIASVLVFLLFFGAMAVAQSSGAHP